ncbi:hypothetical protein LB572_25240, partial [Mesorhizobium sp. BH1-1-5]|uniref:hypothetical protein n=1 Tax=Mesorhizobium sp. BH1-1-5 TaxID=2876661 RepID=UPI001CCE4508
SNRMAIRFEAQSLFSHKVSSVQIQGVFQRSEALVFPGKPLIRPLRGHLLPQGEKGKGQISINF